MVKRRKGKSKRGIDPGEPEELRQAPHSFVIKRGKIGRLGMHLMMDIRKVLEPNTAVNLKLRKNNVIKDFVAVASIFHVTHIIVLTRTSKAIYIRFCRLPHGPTLVFKITKYALGRDVISSLRKPVILPNLHVVSPLLVMNGFAGDTEPKSKLMTSMFQNLFPTLDINTVKVSQLKRTVLLNYNRETDTLEFRHYAVRVKPIGISKPMKKLICGKKLPNLGSLASVDDIFDKDMALSESEGEGLDEVEEERHVTLPENLNTRGNLANEKSAIRLTEIGPRMTLKLIKIEDGLMSGKVLYKYDARRTTETNVKTAKQT